MLKVRKCWHRLLQAAVISFFVTRKLRKITEIANTDRESLHMFWTIWRILMKFSGKLWLMIISKVTKSQGFTLFLQDGWIFGKATRGRGEGQGVKLIPPEGFLGLSVVNPRKGSVKELIQPMAAKTRSSVILTYFESITDA